MQCRELIECFFFLLGSAEWHCKIYCDCSLQNLQKPFALQTAIFLVSLIQIYFKSKYSKKLRFLDSNTEGFESIGFDIPLYASLVVRRKPLQKTHCGKVKKTPQNQRRTEYGFEGERYPISSSTVRRRLITVGRKERRPVKKQRKAFNQSNETNDRSGKKKYKD